MKLLCINTSVLKDHTGEHTGEGLEEGKIYETIGEPYKDKYSDLCYYITGLGSKLMCRFTKVIEEPKPCLL